MNSSHHKSWLSIAGAVLIAAALSACDSGPPHLDNIKLGKDEGISTETATFATTETVYAKAKIAGSPEKVSVKWELYLDKVEGQPEGLHNPGTDASIDLTGGQNIGTYHLTPPPSGWPKGAYHVEIHMLASGEEKDKKTANFTVN